MQENRFSIAFGGGSEYEDLVVHAHVSQELHSVRSDVHSDIGSVGIGDGHLTVLLFFHSVNQSLIQVQDQDLALSFFDLWELGSDLGTLWQLSFLEMFSGVHCTIVGFFEELFECLGIHIVGDQLAERMELQILSGSAPRLHGIQPNPFSL